jgi:two-component SAPR family response regulator
VFATGYDETSIESRFSDIAVLQKPFEPRGLVEAVKRALAKNIAPSLLKKQA